MEDNKDDINNFVESDQRISCCQERKGILYMEMLGVR